VVPMALSRLEKAPLYKKIANSLIEEIVGGSLEMGAKLNESVISDQLGVSRTPVREALRFLEAEGWIEEAEGAGYAVFSPSLEDFKELSECRMILEALAARKMAELATPAQIEELSLILIETKKALDAGEATELMEATQRFHQHIVECCQNRHVQKILKPLKSRIRLYRYLLAQSERPNEFFPEHDRIFQSILNGDGEGAEQNMLQHLANDRETMGKYYSTHELKIGKIRGIN
jgi:DNA-binding GntR family transcriptional regulator